MLPVRWLRPVGVEPVDDAEEQKEAPVLTLPAALRAFGGLPVLGAACDSQLFSKGLFLLSP